MAGAAEKRVALAAIAGAHGVKGELRLKLFAEGVASLKAQKAVFVGDDERRLVAVRDGGKGPIARIEGVDTREAAEALRGSLIEVPRAALPDLGEDEYYFEDLVGLAVVDEDGAASGRVLAVQNFGASDIVEIELPTGKTVMVPMIDAAIPEWDEERMVVRRDFLDA